MGMKKILINAEQPNEVRIAYLDDGKLVDFEIESAAHASVKGNIYVGVVSAVKTDLEGAFIEIGEERQGLLAFNRAGGRTSRDVRALGSSEQVEPQHPDLVVGQKILVQVLREARGDKGCALSMELSIPGRFIVLKPNSSVRAVTRNVSEAARMRLREFGDKLPVVENVGWIIRTTAVNHTLDEITGDFHRMMNLWRNIQRAFEENQGRGPLLVFSDNTLVHRVLRDRLRRDGTTVVVDDPSLYRESRSYASDFMPELRDQIEQYRGDRPLFDAFRVERDVARTFERKVSLPSGGELVFDPTEALLAIDVNSARNTGRDNLEETALHTNLEAAREIARQVMIRNIGGLAVIDFIDMLTEGNNEKVEAAMRQGLARDTANSTCSLISEFGLMELNRQRRRPSIYDTHFEECPHCEGARFIKRTETNANQILRELSYLLHDPAKPENQYLCRVPSDVAAYVLNKERQYLRDLELNTRKQIVVIADSTLTNDGYDIKARRVKALDFQNGSNLEEVLDEEREEIQEKTRPKLPSAPRSQSKPLVTPMSAAKPKKKTERTKGSAGGGQKKQKSKRKSEKGAISRFFGALFGGGSKKSKAKKDQAKSAAKRRTASDRAKTGSTQRTRGRGAGQQEANRRRDGSRSRTGNGRTPRRTDSQRQNTQTTEPRRATRRESPETRERGGQTRNSRSDADARKPRESNDNVRRAADLKRSSEGTSAEPRRPADAQTPNRRAPRSNRTVGPQSEDGRSRQRNQTNRSGAGGVDDADGSGRRGRGREPQEQRPLERGPRNPQSPRTVQARSEPQTAGEQPEAGDERNPTRRTANARTANRSGAPQDPANVDAQESSRRTPPETAEASPAGATSRFVGNDPRARSNRRTESNDVPANKQPAIAGESAKPSVHERTTQQSESVPSAPTRPATRQESPSASSPQMQQPTNADAPTHRAGNDPRKRSRDDSQSAPST